MANQKTPDLIQHVSESLCRNAFDPINSHSGFCPECQFGQCTLWPTFKQEAEAVIKTVREYDRKYKR